MSIHVYSTLASACWRGTPPCASSLCPLQPGRSQGSSHRHARARPSVVRRRPPSMEAWRLNNAHNSKERGGGSAQGQAPHKAKRTLTDPSRRERNVEGPFNVQACYCCKTECQASKQHSRNGETLPNSSVPLYLHRSHVRSQCDHNK